MKRNIIPALALAALCVAGCSDDDEKPTGPDPRTPFPHAQPTAATMEVDVQDLEAPGAFAAPQGICHAWTTVVVAWVNLNVQVRLAIPAAALGACGQQPSIYLGDQTWRWTASGGQGTGAWTAELTARVVSASRVDWAMRISGTPLGLDRFLWFEGYADVGADEGMWTYYDPRGAQPTNGVVECTWSLPSDAEADRTLEFENVDETGAEFGDLLQYELADSIATISYFDASAQATTEARWDLSDGSGGTTNAQGQTCCWGPRPLYPDVACP